MIAHAHSTLYIDATGVQYNLAAGIKSGGTTGGLYGDTNQSAPYPGIRTGSFGGFETRPANTAYAPRLHV
ncbi:hypothetical protein [Achromobacter aloeverae]